MKHQGLFKSSMILLLATTISKLLGAVFKIPLTNLLGGVGMGYYASAYGLFIPIYTILSAGIPLALIRLVSKYCAKGEYKTVRRLRKIAATVFFITGLLGTVLMCILAKPFSIHIAKNPECIYCVLALAPSLVFCSLASIERGYFEGMRNMYPTAISQVIESIAKTIFGLLLSILMIRWGIRQYELYGTVFGRAVSSYTDAQDACLPFGAMGAMLGSTVSEIVGFLAVKIKARFFGDGITKSEFALSKKPERYIALTKELFVIALPLVMSAVISGISSFADITTVMSGLNEAVNRKPFYFADMYKGMKISEIPTFLYGSYNGLTGTVISFVPIIASLLSKSSLPSISAVSETKDKVLIKRNIENIMQVNLLFSVPAGFGICAMSKQILTVLYPQRPEEVSVCVLPLAILGIGAVFVAITLPVNSMLCAVGKEKSVAVLMTFSTVFRLALNYYLIRIPEINILGASLSATITNIIVVSISMKILCKSVDANLKFKRIFAIPFALSSLCCIGLVAIIRPLESQFSSAFAVVVSGFCAIFAYILMLFCLKVLKKGDLSAFFSKKHLK